MDSIGNMLTQIRNACKAKYYKVDIPFSKIKLEIAKLLKEEGFIKNVKVSTGSNKFATLRLYLKYTASSSVLTGLKRISKCSLRKYTKCQDIPTIFNNFGLVVMSTSKGIMSGLEARKSRIGGEILCYVW